MKPGDVVRIKKGIEGYNEWCGAEVKIIRVHVFSESFAYVVERIADGVVGIVLSHELENLVGLEVNEAFFAQVETKLSALSLNEYAEGAARTMGHADLTCAALGLSGESGEFADLIKKHVYHRHELDKVKAAKELGDILWYLALGAKQLGYTLQEIAQMNLDKLKARYPQGFTVEASKHNGG